jgi:4-hydroxyacetophenone monooxygenase
MSMIGSAPRLSQERSAAHAKCVGAVRDEAVLRTALETADIVPLLLAEAQLSGRTDLLDETAAFISGGWSYMEAVPEDLRARIRDRLVETLRHCATAGPAALMPPDRTTFARLMSTGVGQPVPDDYVAMMMEEMTEEDEDARSVPWRRPVPQDRLDHFRVVIVGAGLSGICMGIKLHEAGIPFIIYEKNPEVGGTWYENTYPGCGVDIPNHFYSFSFALKQDWSRHFAKHDELWTYLNDCVDRYGIRDNIRFGHSVLGARFDEARARWAVQVRGPDGSEKSMEANVFVSGVGQLNRPAIPDLPGLAEFKGPAFHTARWDHSVSLAGTRVALIGTGASSMQVGPAVAPEVEKLMVFQRTPTWANPNPNYHLTVTDGMSWVLQNIPYAARWHRVLLSWASGDGFHASLQVDPEWNQPGLSLNEENHRFRERLIAHIRSELGDRTDLIEKLIPSYPPYGKRMLRDNHWYKTLRRDNVELVSTGVRSLTADGVVDSDGRERKADIIVWATGFETTAMLAPMDIWGRGGRSIRDAWGAEDPRAYLGMTVVGFPNFFVLFGPNTALSHGGSLFFHAECQVRYVMQCLRQMLEMNHASMEVRAAPHDAYNRSVDDAHSRMVWANAATNSWYKNSKGRVFTNSPWRIVDYWKLTYALNPADYRFTAHQVPF